MQFVQLLLTDDQSAKLKVAADLILQDERYVLTEEEAADYQRLSVYFEHVAASPASFAPRGEMATAVKRIVRRAKGPAQPASRKNTRKVRQERRMSFAKRRRAERKEFAEAYNAAVAQMEADRAEMEAAQAELLEKLQTEPKFQVVNAAGQVILDGIPESMVRRVEEPRVEFEMTGEAKPEIILPGTAEALGLPEV